MAGRLSEIPEWNVLLLEAGGDPPEVSENPFRWSETLASKYDWAFRTERNARLWKGMEDGRCLISRGHALGGSSSINAMVYLQGTKNDFAYWEDHGCTGWGYEDVVSYFKKSEDFVDAKRFDARVHGRGGPLTVSPMKTYDRNYGVISVAENTLNLPTVRDLNAYGRPVIGCGGYDSTTRDGRRCSTLKAFLLPASDRPNLYVAKNTIVTRILMHDGAATGVEFYGRQGAIQSVYCTKEVVLSAGPIKSPQLLMLSGIGPREHLESLGIHVVADLPVGYNMHDHPSYPGLVFTDRKCRPRDLIREETDDWLHAESGLFAKNVSTTGLTRLVSFLKSRPELEYPDLQLINIKLPYQSINNTPNKKNIMSNLFGYDDRVCGSYEELNSLSDTVLIIPVFLQPTSTGRVELRSTDPLDDPKIFADYLQDQEEIDALLYGIEFVVRLSETEEMSAAGLRLEKLKLDECDGLHVWGTRDYWLCAIEYLLFPFYHVVGTCKMGSADDCSTVVDPWLRVNGILGLRVADSSVMPKIVSVNTNPTTIMIGEKASDIIKECYLEGFQTDD